MLYESLQEIGGAGADEALASPRAAAVTAPLPAGVVWCERVAAGLRAALREAGLTRWRIFHCDDLDLDDLDEYLPKLDPRARWQPLAPAVLGGEAVDLVKREHARLSLRPAGWVRVARYDVAVARWYWVGQDGIEELCLGAAPTVAHFRRLHRRVVRARRAGASRTWQVVAGHAWRDARRPREPVSADDLLLDEAVRARV